MGKLIPVEKPRADKKNDGKDDQKIQFDKQKKELEEKFEEDKKELSDKISKVELENKVLLNELNNVRNRYKQLEQFILKEHPLTNEIPTKIEDIVQFEERRGTRFKNDPEGPSDQRFYCISYISSDKIANLDTDLINIRSRPDGVLYSTEEEANEALEYYHQLDPNLDVAVGATGKWVAFKKLNEVKNQRFDDKNKSKLFEACKENLKKTEEHKRIMERDKEEKEALKELYASKCKKEDECEKYRKEQMLNEYKIKERQTRKNKKGTDEDENFNIDEETKRNIEKIRNIADEQEEIKKNTIKLTTNDVKENANVSNEVKTSKEKALEQLAENMKKYSKNLETTQALAETKKSHRRRR